MNVLKKLVEKIRDAEVQKIPFMLIIGEKEVEEGKVSVRKHKEGDIGTFTIEEFAEMVNNEINKELN